MRTRDERLQDEVERLTEEVDRTLGISDSYQQRVRDRLGDQPAKESETKDKPSTDTLHGKHPQEKLSETSGDKGTVKENDRATGRGESEETYSELGHVFPHLARKKPSL